LPNNQLCSQDLTFHTDTLLKLWEWN